MIHSAIPALVVLLALPVSILPAEARDTPFDLAGGCARASTAALREGSGAQGTGVDATRLEVIVADPSGAPPPSLRAAHLHATAQGAATRPAELEQAATAASAALLSALAGRHGTPCPDPVLERAAAPLARGLSAGGRYRFDWQDVSVHAGSTRLGAGHLSLQLDGHEGTAHLTAVLKGAVSNDPAAALLPEALAVRASLPDSELPGLFSAAGGQGAPVDVTIEHIDAQRGETTLDGQGQARLSSNPDAASGQGHVTVHGLDALLDAAAGLNRIRTALFLAKLVAHRQGDQADWDLAWQGGALMVNNVPLPLR